MYFPSLSSTPNTAIPTPTSKVAKDDNITGKFDPTALERGARALKEIDVSPNATKAFEITKLQEISKQKELQREIEQLSLARSQNQHERSKQEGEDRRKNIDHQQEQERVTAQYKAQLENEAYQKKLQNQQKQNEDWLAKQHAQFLRQEEIKKKTEQELLQLKLQQLREEKNLDKEIARAKVQEETKGRIQQQRENIDVNLREMRAQSAENRKTRIESIQTVFSGLSSAFNTLLDDPAKRTALVGGITAVALGIYGARMGTIVAGKAIEARMGKPPLVRETSRWSVSRSWSVLNPKYWFSKKAEKFTEKIILPPELSEKLQWTTNSLLRSKKNDVPFRHLCLYGAPGTGKTLFARTLAQQSGMDYAIMTGGDVGPLGKDATAELNKLFAWANSSTKKGLILFIDEADSFLRQGRATTTSGMSEDMRNALSAFLHHTGTETKNFCVILATNCREILDQAVLDRVDEQFEFPVPMKEERLKMIRMFIEEYITQKENTIVMDKNINEQYLESVAIRTEGFSGRQLAKLIIGMQAAVFGSGAKMLTKGLAETVLNWKLSQRYHQP